MSRVVNGLPPSAADSAPASRKSRARRASGISTAQPAGFARVRGRVAALLALLSVSSALSAEHPRWLITPEVAPELRRRCANASDAFGRDFAALRASLAGEGGQTTLPGELAAISFVSLMSPADAGAYGRRERVERALQDIDSPTLDPLEALIALDWMWAELDAEIRQKALGSLRRRAAPLSAADSPLNPGPFREKLAALLLALLFDERDDRSPSWRPMRTQLLDAARRYYAEAFPNYVRWRGLSPTSPSSAAGEECLTALAVEALALLQGPDAWVAYRDSVGRWLEHYLMTASATRAALLRDDGDSAARLPTTRWNALLPLTAHLIANRTHDRAAVAVARQVEAELRGAPYESGAPYWRWAPLVLSLDGLAACDSERLPAARNLDGAIVCRAGETLVWIDSGQPCLRRGQHADSGSFLVQHRGADVVVEAGDHVALEATAAKGGEQRLGAEKQAFDFEQFFVSTIAHNALLFPDSARAYHWRERPFLPVGGQRPHDTHLNNFAVELEKTERLCGELLAYGLREWLVYAAVDLAPAYDARSVRACSREFIFLDGRALIVVDRATPAAPRVSPTLILQIPKPPRVNDAPLEERARVLGAGSAGAWRYVGPAQIAWSNAGATAWLTSLMPQERATTVVGGPAERIEITQGRYRGMTYIGGSQVGFERLIAPVSQSRRPANAWYRLGKPELLGPDFATREHWGRVEIESLGRAADYVFVSVLCFGEVGSTSPSLALNRTEGAGFDVDIDFGAVRYRVKLLADARGGAVLSSQAEAPWPLPKEIQREGPLPAESEPPP